MKTLMLAAAASLAFAGVASAQTPDQANFTINGDNPAKCGVTPQTSTVTLGADVISDGDGFARNDLSAAIASGLNSASVYVYCTGTKNGILLGRTSLQHTSGGGQTPTLFNRNVIYDITMNVSDAVRGDNYTPTEGTSDGDNGTGTGPGSPAGTAGDVGPFGPSGLGTLVVFASESASNATSVGGTNYDPRSAYTPNGNRLLAGAYTGQVRLTLRPGV